MKLILIAFLILPFYCWSQQVTPVAQTSPITTFADWLANIEAMSGINSYRLDSNDVKLNALQHTINDTRAKLKRIDSTVKTLPNDSAWYYVVSDISGLNTRLDDLGAEITTLKELSIKMSNYMFLANKPEEFVPVTDFEDFKVRYISDMDSIRKQYAESIAAINLQQNALRDSFYRKTLSFNRITLIGAKFYNDTLDLIK